MFKPGLHFHRLLSSINYQGYTEAHFIYRFHLDSFNALLESYGLLFKLEVPLTMPTTVLLQTIQASMESSHFNYRFADPTPLGSSTTGILPHESLPLSLLGLVNRGRTHPTLDEVRLRTEPAHNLTVGMLISDQSLRAKFANPALCIESGRLVLHLCKFCVFIIMHIANFLKRYSTTHKISFPNP